MLLDEDKSKALFTTAGIAVPPGVLVRADAPRPASLPFSAPFIVKAQVLCGGRGKAGGVLRAETPAELDAALARVFSLSIGGEPVRLARVEPAVEHGRELYLSLSVSRDRGCLVLAAGAAGGVDVEGGSAEVHLECIDLPGGPEPHQVRAAFFALRLPREAWGAFKTLAERLWRAVRDNGLLLAEINPLVHLPGKDGGRFLALDAKCEVDSSLLPGRADLEAFHEPLHLTEEERISRAAGFAYVSLKGSVGLLANGAGLAMATMDSLNLAGLPAANFLDLGGAADEGRMRQALGMLFGDARVRAVFINLYGGILSCGDVARALSSVLGGRPPARPLVVRMAGNGAADGLAVLAGLGLPHVHVVSDMAQALDALRGLVPAAPPMRVEAGDAPHAPTKAALDSDGDGLVSPSPLAAFALGAGSPVLVQGATGKVAGRHMALMRSYGTNIVAGVTPFKGGTEADGVPIYDSVAQAVAAHEIEASIIFVPGPFAADAALEAARAGIPWVVCITEGIAQQDMLAALPALRRTGARLVGPNTPGVIVPGRTKIGIMPAEPFTPGPVAVFSRSGTLTYEAAARLSAAGIGQSFCIGVGGDPFTGLSFIDCLRLAAADPQTQAVLLIGEIGGRAEEDAADFIRSIGYPKPVAAFVAGITAPPGKRLGHAGAILEESTGGAGRKLAALRGAGLSLCAGLDEIPEAVRAFLRD